MIEYESSIDIILEKQFFTKYFISLIHHARENDFRMLLTVKPISSLNDKGDNKGVVVLSYFIFALSLLISISYTTYSKLKIQKKYKKDLEIEYFEELNQ